MRAVELHPKKTLAKSRPSSGKSTKSRPNSGKSSGKKSRPNSGKSAGKKSRPNSKKGKKKDAGGIKGPNGKTFKKGERRLANRQERERKGKAFLEVYSCVL